MSRSRNWNLSAARTPWRSTTSAQRSMIVSSVLDAALVVVGKVENKEVVEVEPPDRLFHFC